MFSLNSIHQLATLALVCSVFVRNSEYMQEISFYGTRFHRSSGDGPLASRRRNPPSGGTELATGCDTPVKEYPLYLEGLRGWKK